MPEFNMDQIKSTLETFKGNVEQAVSDKIASGLKDSSEEVVGLKENVATLTGQIEAITKSIEERKSLEIPGLSDEIVKQKFDFGMFSKGALNIAKGVRYEKAWEGAEYEKEIIDEYAKKAQTAGDGSEGGYTIPEEASKEFVDLTVAKMPLFKLGINRLNNLHGDLPIPKLTSRNLSYWVGENEAPTESSNTFGQFTLRPKKLGAFTKLSRRLAYQSRGVADTIVKNQLSTAMALGMHNGILNGIGSESQPLGITQTPNLGVYAPQATNGARFRIDKAAALIQFLDSVDELGDDGSFGFVMRPEAFGGMKRERVEQYSGAPVGDGQPLTADFILQSKKQLEANLGYALTTTTQLSKTLTCGTSSTCSDVIFGNWAQFYVGMWRGLEIRVSEHASDTNSRSAFLDDMFYLVAFAEIDSHVGRESAFVKTSDAETLETNW